jgi:hypothetical protein
MALVLYAVFSAPTPDHPGLVEVMIGILMIAAVGLSGAVRALRPEDGTVFWRGAGQALLFYGLSVALVNGAIRAHPSILILRDILPFFYLLLPVFLMPFFQERPHHARAVLLCALGIGIMFSLRALGEIYGTALTFLKMAPMEEPAYFANAPTVLFAALYMIGSAGARFVKAERWQDMGIALFIFAGAILPLCAMALALQRASLAYVCVYVAILMALALYRYPRRGLMLVLGGLVLIWPFHESIGNLAQTLLLKTTSFGTNMREEEMAAAWRELSASPMSALFGGGWGATFESPAVGGVRVNYTHSLLTSALLKTGLAGLALALAYLGGLGRVLFAGFARNPVLALALAGPVIIDVFLYASFKSLDFGLVLLLIPLFATSGWKVASRPSL